MPQWVINLMLPYVMPTILAMLTPILSEYIKKMYEYLLGHLSPPVMMALATGVAAAVNQASEWLAGASLPYGLAPLIALFVNTVGNAFDKTPPTPGMPQPTLPDPAK